MTTRATAERAAAQLLNTPVAMHCGALSRVLAAPVKQGENGAEAGLFFDFMFDDEVGDGTPYNIEGGVAVIPVMGTLFDWRYEAIQTKVEHALRNPEVVGVLLDIDSGGGSVDGNFDLVDFLFEANKEKPLWAIANHFAASAAFNIASTARQIGITRTAGVGSVGVIATHVEFSKEDEMMGWTYTTVFAGARKNDSSIHKPFSKTARDNLQTDVDELHTLFIDQVARNRGLSPEAVRDTEAGVFSREAALEAGFADQITTYDDFLAAFQAALRTPDRSSARSTTAAQVPHNNEVVAMADENDATGTQGGTDPQAANVRSIDDARSSGAEEGRASARADAQEINQLCILAGCPERAGELIADGKTPAEVRSGLLEAQQTASGAEEVSGRHAESMEETGRTEGVEYTKEINVFDVYRKRDAERAGYQAQYANRVQGGN